MFYVSRKFICERLGVSKWASYGMFAATSIGRIPSDRVIALLNESRKAGEERLDFIPSDIVTADQLAEETGIPAHSILVWTRRSKKVPPHFRINKHTTRFRRSSFAAWLDMQCSKPKHSRAYTRASMRPHPSGLSPLPPSAV